MMMMMIKSRVERNVCFLHVNPNHTKRKKKIEKSESHLRRRGIEYSRCEIEVWLRRERERERERVLCCVVRS